MNNNNNIITFVSVAVVFAVISIFIIIIIITVRNKTPNRSTYLRPSCVKLAAKLSVSVLTTRGVVNCLVALK
jgi:hypothetical protein